MPFGTELSYSIKPDNFKGKLFRSYLKFFGTLDLHIHIRYFAVNSYVEKKDRTLSIGSGNGLMEFRLFKEKKICFDIVEPDENRINNIKKIANEINIKNFTIFRDKLPELDILKNTEYNQVLLIDVIEHIKEDEIALIKVNDLLVDGGIVIISVPTPNYPKFFGKEFANEIGHKRDGYFLEDMENLLNKTGFELVSSKYYTGKFWSNVCKLWYTFKIPLCIKMIFLPLLEPICKFDWMNGKKTSSSLLLKAIKVKR